VCELRIRGCGDGAIWGTSFLDTGGSWLIDVGDVSVFYFLFVFDVVGVLAEVAFFGDGSEVVDEGPCCYA